MLTMIHANRAHIAGNTLRIDRKFLEGMRAYVDQISTPICAINPEGGPSLSIMDPVEVPIDRLGFKVMTLTLDKSGRVATNFRAALEQQLKASKLVYGAGFGAIRSARALGIPYVPVLEYDLKTEILMSTSAVSNPIRRIARAVRQVISFTSEIPSLRKAVSLHCNGYPVYDQMSRLNRNRLLYLDSRMSADTLVHSTRLADRLAHRTGPIKLLYSGRYERSKGASDAIHAALTAQRLGVNLQLHTYGQGSLKDEMCRLAAESNQASSIVIHDAIPYPDLVKVSQEFDAFLCCHIQSDPSCTYVESLGAGLPIVGYANRMWSRLRDESNAGYATPIGNIDQLAIQIKALGSDSANLNRMSLAARAFAANHTFEREFMRRTDALNALLRN